MLNYLPIALLISDSYVIYKLLGFTLAMVCVPIGSYFLTLNLLFRGKQHNTSCRHGSDGS
jgi:hypothetical protein